MAQRLDEKILDYIKRAGPSTPIEVAQRVGTDSIIVAAVLVDAASQQKIRKSKRKVSGSYRYYYYPEQESELQRRINNSLTPQDKDMIQRLLNQKIMSELNVSPQEVSILSGLEDLVRGFTFEYNNKIFRGWSMPNISEDKAREDIMKTLRPVAPVAAPAPAVQVKVEPKVIEVEVKKKLPRSPGQRSRKKGKSRSQSRPQSQSTKSQGKKKKAERKREPKLRKSSKKR